MEAFKLVDLPPNKITPEYLGDWAKNLGKKSTLEVKVFDVKKSKIGGFGCFFGGW